MITSAWQGWLRLHPEAGRLHPEAGRLHPEAERG